jgi:hypothetical protein
MATTVLGPGGYSRPPYGSFAGKVPSGIDAGSSISGGFFSRKRWHTIKAMRGEELKHELAAEEELASIREDDDEAMLLLLF